MATRLADLAGAINGINQQFTTPTPYQTGSIVVRKDATNLLSSEIREIDPATGVVELVTPPATGSVLVAAYQDPTSSELTKAVAANVTQLQELSVSGGNDLVFAAGQSGFLLEFRVYDKDFNPVDLRDYDLFFAARRDSEVGTLVLDKTSFSVPAGIVLEDQTAAATRGKCKVTFTSAEVSAQAAQILAWDFWARNETSADIIPLIRDGRLEVRAAVRTSFPASP